MWCLPTNAHKEWYDRYYYRNDKESYTFQRQNPFILNISINFFNKSTLSFAVWINYKEKLGAFHRNL